MADNNFRSYRSHDPLARPGDRAPASAQIADPLAELARLIGQTEATEPFGRGAAEPAAYAPEPAGAPDWAADDRYAAAREPAPETYSDGYPEEAERYDEEFADPPSDQFPLPRLNGARDDDNRHATPQPRVRAEVAPPREFQIPAFLPRGRDDRYDYNDEEQGAPDDQAYAAEEYEDEAPSPRRRSGFVLVAAILGARGARYRRCLCLSVDVRRLDAAVAAADHQGRYRPDQDHAECRQRSGQRIRPGRGEQQRLRREARFAGREAGRCAAAGERGAARSFDYSDLSGPGYPVTWWFRLGGA